MTEWCVPIKHLAWCSKCFVSPAVVATDEGDFCKLCKETGSATVARIAALEKVN